MKVNLIQGSPEWHEFRKSHIGGSDIVAIMGVNPYKTAYEVWLDKTGRSTPTTINKAMQHGIDNEPIAREVYERDNLTKAPAAVYESDNVPYFAASLDGETQDRNLEIKCPVTSGLTRLTLNGDIPLMYQHQAQWGLLNTGKETCDFMVFDARDGTYALMPILADKKLHAAQEKAGKEFWQDYILTDTPPPLTKEEYEHVQEDELNQLAIKLRIIKNQKAELAEAEAALRVKLIEKLPGDKYYFPEADMKMYRSTANGNINYKSLMADLGIDKETQDKYRGNRVERITFV